MSPRAYVLLLFGTILFSFLKQNHSFQCGIFLKCGVSGYCRTEQRLLPPEFYTGFSSLQNNRAVNPRWHFNLLFPRLWRRPVFNRPKSSIIDCAAIYDPDSNPSSDSDGKSSGSIEPSKSLSDVLLIDASTTQPRVQIPISSVDEGIETEPQAAEGYNIPSTDSINLLVSNLNDDDTATSDILLKDQVDATASGYLTTLSCQDAVAQNQVSEPIRGSTGLRSTEDFPLDEPSAILSGDGLENHPFAHELYIQSFNHAADSDAGNTASNEVQQALDEVVDAPRIPSALSAAAVELYPPQDQVLSGVLHDETWSPPPSDGSPTPDDQAPRRLFSQDVYMAQLSRPDALPSPASGPAPQDPTEPASPLHLGLVSFGAQAQSEPDAAADPAQQMSPPAPAFAASVPTGATDGGGDAGRRFTQEAFMSQLSRPAPADSPLAAPDAAPDADESPAAAAAAAAAAATAAAMAGRRVFNKDGYLALLARGPIAEGGGPGLGSGPGTIGGRDSAATYLSSLHRYTDDGIRLSGVSRYSEEVRPRPSRRSESPIRVAPPCPSSPTLCASSRPHVNRTWTSVISREIAPVLSFIC
jgi:hypothetical protein